MDFILLGFSQVNNVRRFRFQTVTPDKIAHDFTVDADLQMVRRYSIATQELPLLCRRLLETRGDTTSRTVVFTEAEMQVYAGVRAAEAEAVAQKHKAFRKRPHTGIPPTAPGLKTTDGRERTAGAAAV